MSSSFNLQPERAYIQADALPDIVDKYIADARLRRLKPETIASYEFLLALLLEWWAVDGPALSHQLDERAWQRFAAWMEKRPAQQAGKPLALSVRQKAMSVCRQLLKWCQRYGFLDRDYAYQIPKVSGEQPLRILPRRDELRRMLDATAESYRPIRDAAIVAVLLGTGIRRAEASGLDVEDVEFYADGGGLLHVRKAKLGKSRSVAFDKACGAYLTALLDELGRTAGPLFTEWKERRLSPKGVSAAIKRAMQSAGIERRGSSAHDMRRYFATDQARHNQGADSSKKNSMQMGHASGRMTDRYIILSPEDLLEGFVSPLSRLEDDIL